jgi:hypothetical protein
VFLDANAFSILFFKDGSIVVEDDSVIGSDLDFLSLTIWGNKTY